MTAPQVFATDRITPRSGGGVSTPGPATTSSPWAGLTAMRTASSRPSELLVGARSVLIVGSTEHRVGASTCALGVAEAAVRSGVSTVLVDGLEARWSGLRAAMESEGPRVVRASSVCQGRRGDLRIRYTAGDGVAPPEEFFAQLEGVELIVVDAGMLTGRASAWLEHSVDVFVVAALTRPGVARAEACLEEVGRRDIKLLGLSGIATRFDPRSGAGMEVTRALEGVWAPIPRDAALEVSGTTPAPLPGAVVDALAPVARAAISEDLAARVSVPSHRGLWRRSRTNPPKEKK